MKKLSPSISGCDIGYNGRSITKTTKESSYFPRIAKQAKKQILMRSILGGYNIIVPEVYSIFLDGFEMEYLPFTGFIHHTQTSNVKNLKEVFTKVLEFVSDALCDATETAFVEIDLVEAETNKPNFPKQYSWLGKEIKRLPISELPFSYCHGDLTFSNFLFGDGKLALIDFNDVVVESPIFDVIKLRQDTKHNWTSFMTKEYHDKRKIKTFNEWVDSCLETVLLRNRIDMRKYAYWEALNYYRIFRNVNEDPDICNYLVRTIKEIIE